MHLSTVSLCIYLSTYLSTRLLIYSSIYPFLSLSIYLSICLSVCQSIHLSIPLLVYASIYSSASLSIYFFVCLSQLTHEVITEYDVTKHLLACGNSVNAAICRMYDDVDYSEGDYEDVGMEREEKVMIGFLEHLLPKVREHVKVLDLAYGKSLTCEMVSILLGYFCVCLYLILYM